MTVVLLNGQYRPEVDVLGAMHGAPLMVDQAASDPVPTCTFTIDDTGSQIKLARLQEVVVIDNDAFANPTQNLLKNPTLSPIGTNWITTSAAGLAATQNGGGGVIITATNAAINLFTFLDQTTQKGLCQPGQNYMASVTMTGNNAVGFKGYLAIIFSDAQGLINLGGQSGLFVVSNAAQRFSIQMVAPAGAAFVDCFIGVESTVNNANSGTITLTQVQLEPTWFTSAGPSISYPTPFVDVSQANCTLLPNGTCVRQQRLFAGYVTHWLNGPYSGKNRAIQVSASGPAFLIAGRLVAKSYSNKHDDEIIVDVVASYFSGIFTTNHVQRGVLYASVAYNYDDARTVFDALASTSTNRWFVDPYFDIWYIPPGFYMAPYGLSDTPDSVTTFVYSEYTSENDFTQPCNNAYVLVNGGPNFVRTADVQAVANTGFIFDRKISDSSITTNAVANQRGLAEVLGYAYERAVLHLQIDQRAAQPFLVPGTAIAVTNSIENFSNVSYLIQKVRIVVKGVDQTNQTRYLYQMDLGAYQPLLSNILARSARAAAQSSSTSLSMVEDHVDIVEYVGYQDSISIHN